MGIDKETLVENGKYYGVITGAPEQTLNSELCGAIDLVKIERVLVRMVREKKIAFKDAANYRTLLQSTLELLRGKL